MNGPTAYKCKQCGQVMYPHHFRCLNCNGREFDEIPLAGQARLLTYSEVWNLPWGIDERSRILGVVEFENGVKAMGWLKTSQPKLGMRLQAGWEPVRVVGGEEVYGLALEPVPRSK